MSGITNVGETISTLAGDQGVTLAPTCGLRWRVPTLDSGPVLKQAWPVLEQAWQAAETGNIHWIPVPTVVEDKP
jgi:hypothetical protein